MNKETFAEEFKQLLKKYDATLERWDEYDVTDEWKGYRYEIMSPIFSVEIEELYKGEK